MKCALNSAIICMSYLLLREGPQVLSQAVFACSDWDDQPGCWLTVLQ